jgi:MFS family permease
VSQSIATAPSAAIPPSFAALRHPGFRWFFVGSAAAMLADSIEHVISYWVVFQKFHSPALAGFAVISHWLPFLALSVHVGGLADRLDSRRIIQCGMVLFMLVSISWGLLFTFDVLEQWHAMVLLVLHGIAGVLWNPPSQVLIHDIVGPSQLTSAVRLNATSRYLGLLIGPSVGSLLLLTLGPAHGIFVNALIYLPLFLWLWKAPYGPRFRSATAVPRRAVRGFKDVIYTFREIGDNRALLSMMLLAGAASFFIGNSYQAQMPGFATDLGHGAKDLTYGVLLGADAAGALTAGIVLESLGLLRANPRVAFVLAFIWSAALGMFALSTQYALALALLFVAGFAELSFSSMAQAIVQLQAPAAIRGQVIGVYNMSALGLRMFAGFSVGLLGSVIGIHYSLSVSALAFAVVIALLAATNRRKA